VVTWRSHLGDLAKLQTAQGLGQVHNTDALQAAIDQAVQVPLGHPRRVQAQTMVAHWRQEIERLEDRPYLVQAHEAARPKTAEGLQSAIQIAATIPIHRALRSEAQSWIYVWTNELQVMADRPMLDQARSLAAQGNLSQAIVAASGIQPGRALYDEARAAIAGWQWEIAAAEQARLRALQRAAAPLPEATPETLPVDETLATPELGAPEQDALAPTPGTLNPWYQRLRERSRQQSPLPDRLETIPGEAPSTPAGATAPVMPRSPQAPVDPATDQAPSDGAPTAPPAPTAPVPDPAIAPSPVLVAPPVPDPQPVEVVPEPVAPTGEPQARQPLAPTISTQPQPEEPVSLAPRWQGPSPQTPAMLLTQTLSASP
jgi:hypothetical protein